MAYISTHDIFRAAMKERQVEHPFLRVSAYKVRESRENVASMIATVTEIIDLVSIGKNPSVPILLGCCTSQDKAVWLKDLPGNIAHELGRNLVPAIQALNVEGVPDAAIKKFVQSIKRSVNQLLTDCDAIQVNTSRSINGEYARMRAGCSEMLGICYDTLSIADQAVALCDAHGV
jgi:hypothetical protein